MARTYCKNEAGYCGAPVRDGECAQCLGSGLAETIQPYVDGTIAAYGVLPGEQVEGALAILLGNLQGLDAGSTRVALDAFGAWYGWPQDGAPGS